MSPVGNEHVEHVEVRAGAYHDSVTLLQVSRHVADVPGVRAAQVAMATPLNVEVLDGMGFDVPAGTAPEDLSSSPSGRDGDEARRWPHCGPRPGTAPASARVGSRRPSSRRGPRAWRCAAPPGRRRGVRAGAVASTEALDAIEAGVDVMIFSDNVPVARRGRAQGRGRSSRTCW